MYAAPTTAERYSAQDTIAAQRNIFLRAGSVLLSNEGRPMARIAATAVACHDTIGGACSCESNTLRYGYHTKSQHACVENFLQANGGHGRGKRDIVVEHQLVHERAGRGRRHAGHRRRHLRCRALYVDLLAEMDVVAVISNCPQINNPCNGFNPTPVRVIIA